MNKGLVIVNTSISSRLRRPAALSGPLYPLLLFFCASLILLSISRLLLIGWQLPRVTAVEGLAKVMWLGLRMDLQIVSYFSFPLLLAALLLPDRWRGLLWKRLQAGWAAVWFAVFMFMECATPSFINQYDVRPNRLFFEYLGNPREVGMTLWADYKFQLLGALLLVATGAYGAWRAMLAAERSTTPWRWPRRLVALPLCALMLFIAARGSLDHRPANPGTAAFSGDHLVNELGVSSTYTALYALYSMRSEKDAGRIYPQMAEDEVNSRMRKLMGVTPAEFTDPASPTMHNQYATRMRTTPMNLVIILEESLGAQYVGSLGGKPYTPNLERLSTQGQWFEHLYATGTRSVRGIEAVTTGFLPTPGRSVVKLSLAQNRFFTIAELLRDAGYNTQFIYGGESQFDNMRGFFLANGFNQVIDENDYPNPAFRGTWGVSDEDLFARAHQEFEAAQKPFFALVFSSSNHPPYEYPQDRIEPLPGDDKRVANAVRYADYALGRFIEQARESDYWQNTLFLIVADHDDVVAGPDLVPVEHFHIPGLILGGTITPQRIQTVASQIDLAPTLLSLMGFTSEHPMPGVDLTSTGPDYTGRAILQYGTTHALLRDGQVAINQAFKEGELYDLVDGHLAPSSHDNPELLDDGLASALWPSLAYRQLLYHAGTTPPRLKADTIAQPVSGDAKPASSPQG